MNLLNLKWRTSLNICVLRSVRVKALRMLLFFINQGGSNIGNAKSMDVI